MEIQGEKKSPRPTSASKRMMSKLIKSVMVSMPTNCCLAESHRGAARKPLYRRAKNAFSIFRSKTETKMTKNRHRVKRQNRWDRAQASGTSEQLTCIKYDELGTVRNGVPALVWLEKDGIEVVKVFNVSEADLFVEDSLFMYQVRLRVAKRCDCLLLVSGLIICLFLHLRRFFYRHI